MMEPFETVERDGFTINLRYEEWEQEAFNPRHNTNLGVMFAEYDRYDLGDEDAPDPRGQEVDCEKCDGSGEYLFEIVDVRAYGRELVRSGFHSLDAAEEYMEQHAPEDAHWRVDPADCENCEGTGMVELSIVDYLKREHGARVILPLFLYEHSGITMRAGGRIDTGEDNFDRRGRIMGDDAGWDTSSVGVIFDTKESREECGCEDFTDERIEEGLNAEVSEYASYLEGEVYYWTVEDEDGEEVESCSGYIGYESKDDMLSEANAAVDAAIKARDHEHAEAQRWACADVVTV